MAVENRVMAALAWRYPVLDYAVAVTSVADDGVFWLFGCPKMLCPCCSNGRAESAKKMSSIHSEFTRPLPEISLLTSKGHQDSL